MTNKKLSKIEKYCVTSFKQASALIKGGDFTLVRSNKNSKDIYIDKNCNPVLNEDKIKDESDLATVIKYCKESVVKYVSSKIILDIHYESTFNLLNRQCVKDRNQVNNDLDVIERFIRVQRLDGESDNQG